MPNDHDANRSSISDGRGEAMDQAPASSADKSTIPGRADNGKGQSDTGRADQIDDKAAEQDEAAHDAFDPDDEQA